MSHPDDELLVDLATGESVDAEVTAHVTRCARCSSEVASLREVLSAVRSPRPQLVPAPAHVWDAVASDIARAEASPSAGPKASPVHDGEGATEPPVDYSQPGAIIE